MTIIHASSVLTVSAAGWGDVQLGRIATSGRVCFGSGYLFNLDTPGGSASGDAGLWCVELAPDEFSVRCGVYGFEAVVEQWYNEAGAGQGDPGTISSNGTAILTLEQMPDSVNIYTSDETSTTGAPVFSTVGSAYTDDDKSTFFVPVSEAKYGRKIQCTDASAPEGNPATEGYVTVQFTFRKAGLSDLTYSFKGHGRALSEWGS